MARTKAPARPSIRDVAREAGVSVASVSYVLNGRSRQHRIPATTQQRIESARQRLGYRPNYLAAAMATRRTQVIGVLFTNSIGDFMVNILAGVQDVLRAHSRHLVLATCEDDPAVEAADLDMMDYRHTDGVLSFPVWTPSRPTHWELFLDTGRPVVFIDRTPRGVDGECVRIHDRRAGSEACGKLHAAGAQRLVLLQDPGDDTITVAEREDGFREAASRLGLPVVSFALSSSLDSLDALLRTHEGFPGLFAPVTSWATKYFAYLHAARREAPTDLCVASVGLATEPLFIRCPWWLAEQPSFEMGRAAATLLLARLGDKIAMPAEAILPFAWRSNSSQSSPAPIPEIACAPEKSTLSRTP